ncbi:MAG: ECF transporter S component [Acidaminococcaceae bacterium]
MLTDNLRKLTLAAMFAAMACICFAYLRIEIPMGGGMTGKIYIGHSFIILSALLLGTKYGALTGAIGLTIADILAGYVTSAPPTFVSKFILGWSVALVAHTVFKITTLTEEKQILKLTMLAAITGTLVCLITEPLIRYSFKVYILGYHPQVAYLSALNCALAAALSAIPDIIISTLLYKTARLNIRDYRHL